MSKKYIFSLTILFLNFSFSQSVILADFFDTPSPLYESNGDYIDSSNQYFGTTNNVHADVDLSYQPVDSDISFFGARQLKNGNETIYYNDTNINDLSDITFLIGIAEDKGFRDSEDWDTGDAVHIQYRLENDSWINLFSIVASGEIDTAPQIDTDNDGFGDGEKISNDFKDFEFDITGLNATTIDFRITFFGLTETEEDIAFKYIGIVTDLNLFPEITITAPNHNEQFENGTTSVDISYSITGNADRVVLIVNEDEANPIEGNTTGGTTTLSIVPTMGNQFYQVKIIAYVDEYDVDDTFINFEISGSTLSIDKTEIENFRVYPNPVNSGKFSISTGSNTLKTVELFDLNGKIVLRKQVKNEEAINIIVLNSRIYILKVTENSKTALRKLLVD